MTAKKEKIKLTVEKRKITGRLPVFKEVGETGLIELKVADEKEARPVLIHKVQFHPVDETPLHVDFYQVDLKEKVMTKVPVELIGESPAIKDKIGILIQPLSEVEVEALPADLPEKIEINISSLKAINDTVAVSDVKLPEGVKVLTEGKEILAKIEPLAKEEEIVVPPPAEGVPTEEVPPEEAAKEVKEEKGGEEEKQPREIKEEK
ncbi:MAG: 50S ribosomal protein L25 [Candidatus Shapirobacteria bacterium]|nr:50S ribosomal protein L25 [Candidatus Shapirobacteria bacterium]